MQDITRQEYADLLEFRTRLRRFLRWSEEQARAVGLTPAQHQLLLAVKGHPGELPPTIRDISERLVLRHHSAVELIDRACGCGLVERFPDPEDGRIVRVRLTSIGERYLDKLYAVHLAEIRVYALAMLHLDLDELRRLAPVIDPVVDEPDPA